jgi:hypothetical protein
LYREGVHWFIQQDSSEYPSDATLNEFLTKIPYEIKLEPLPDPKEDNAEAISKWAEKHMKEFYTWFDPLEKALTDVEDRLKANLEPATGP